MCTLAPAPASPPGPSRVPPRSSPSGELCRTLWDLYRRPDLRLLRATHARLLRLDLLRLDPTLPSLLVSCYSLSRHLSSAVAAFRLYPPTRLLFRSLIRALSDHNLPGPALLAFSRMLALGLPLDPFVIPSLLRSLSSLPPILALHSLSVKSALLSDPFIPNSLLHAYSRLGQLAAARKVFDSMPRRDLFSYNSMLAAILGGGDLSAARQLFDSMPHRDCVSWNTMLDGYSKSGLADDAFDLFRRMPARNVISWTTVISGFCKKGDLDTARALFDTMPTKNLVTWTIVVSAHAERGMAKEASALFKRMIAQFGSRIDSTTLISILAACAESGLLNLGRKVHKWMRRSALDRPTIVCNALLDMYAKCGRLEEAWAVFEGMDSRSLVSWNSMIHSLAVHGRGQRALSLFSQMEEEGLHPNHSTFVAVLCACTHAGLIEDGRRLFESMERDYGVSPRIEHYGCMVDLLGRGGLLEEAFELINSMPFDPNTVIYASFLNACRKQNNVELAEEIFDKFVELDSSDPGVYAIMSNIYAKAELWDGMAKMRLKMKDAGAQKPSGSSYIEVEEVVHEFTVSDKAHPLTELIIQMLDSLDDDLRQPDPILESQWMVS